MLTQATNSCIPHALTSHTFSFAWAVDIDHASLLTTPFTMDDILSSFQGAFSVATNPLDPSGPYPRLTQYKFKREGFADQEARRKKALQEQCLKRKNFADLSRRIVEGDLLSDDEMEEGGKILRIRQSHSHY